MTEVLVAEWLISLPHARKICKILNQKKHSNSNLRIELEELDFDLKRAFLFDQTGLAKRNRVYSDYLKAETAFHLKVYREIRPKE